MERLDAKEYRCKHCGAITVISDDDAERLEKLLASVLSRAAPSPSLPSAARVPAAMSSPGRLILIVLAVMLVVVYFVFAVNRPDRSRPIRSAGDRTVPIDQVTISPLRVADPTAEPAHYAGMIYNHSGYAIDVPRYTMTFYPNGMKGDSTTSSTDLERLLPGEYQPIGFQVWKAQLGSRYEIEQPTRVDRGSTAEIARPELIRQQLIHHLGHGYQLVGVVQNTFARPLERIRVMVILYGPNNEPVGAETRALNDLRPGEQDAVEVPVTVRPKDTAVTAYEYLVDANYSDETRR
jgi:hypothetical protein